MIVNFEELKRVCIYSHIPGLREIERLCNNGKNDKFTEYHSCTEELCPLKVKK